MSCRPILVRDRSWTCTEPRWWSSPGRGRHRVRWLRYVRGCRPGGWVCRWCKQKRSCRSTQGCWRKCRQSTPSRAHLKCMHISCQVSTVFLLPKKRPKCLGWVCHQHFFKLMTFPGIKSAKKIAYGLFGELSNLHKTAVYLKSHSKVDSYSVGNELKLLPFDIY